MSQLDEYAQRYSRAELRREGGVLEIRLHDGNGSSLVWDEPAHRELPDLFADVANDSENHVVILTGSGDSFCASVAYGGWPKLTPATWDKIFTEGRRLLKNLLDIEAPVIGAINGPALYHAELLVLSDIVLSAEHAVLQDAPHFPQAVPADGVHTVWPHLLGPNRGRYFLLSKQVIDAHEAHRLGIVGEVLPRQDLLRRAWELARDIDRSDRLTLKYTRLALTQQLKRAVLTDLPYGLTLEGLAGIGTMP
jgi:enoyl-CoA hydratase/carnithine racemase